MKTRQSKDMANYYKILGVPETASDEEIKKAYRQLALKWHPDKNRDNQEKAARNFRKILKAYKILSDARRRDFDDNRESGPDNKKSEPDNKKSEPDRSSAGCDGTTSKLYNPDRSGDEAAGKLQNFWHFRC